MTCIIRRNNPVHTPLFLLNTIRHDSSHTTFHFLKSNGNTSWLLYRRRFIKAKRMIPSFILLAGCQSQVVSIAYMESASNPSVIGSKAEKDFTFRAPSTHIHTGYYPLIRHLYSKRCFNIFGGPALFKQEE